MRHCPLPLYSACRGCQVVQELGDTVQLSVADCSQSDEQALISCQPVAEADQTAVTEIAAAFRAQHVAQSWSILQLRVPLQHPIQQTPAMLLPGPADFATIGKVVGTSKSNKDCAITKAYSTSVAVSKPEKHMLAQHNPCLQHESAQLGYRLHIQLQLLSFATCNGRDTAICCTNPLAHLCTHV